MSQFSIKKQMYLPLLALFILVCCFGGWAYYEGRAVQAWTLAITEERERLLQSSSSVTDCLDDLDHLISSVNSMTEIIPAKTVQRNFTTIQACVDSKVATLRGSEYASEFLPDLAVLQTEIGAWFKLAAVPLGVQTAASLPTVWTVDAQKQEAYKAAEQLVFDVSDLISRAENRMNSQWVGNLQAAFAVVFCGLVLVLFLAVFHARSIVSPLIRIKDNAQAIASGGKGLAFTDSGRVDEIGDLSKAIGAMHETLNAQVKQITCLAFEDNLTKLRNRAGCQQDMISKIESGKNGSRFALVHLDLDKFKRVNDTLGHAAGDVLLAEIGRRLNRLLDETAAGTAYRWGGDEFLLLVDRVDEALVDLCSELVDVLSIPVQYEDTTIRPTASLGIARFPEDGDTFDALMVYSDIALYKAKENGRDGFHFFTKELKQQIDIEAKIERELRTALQERQLFLVYQPQLDVTSNKVTGIECLVRWQHPQRGVLSPGSFLGVAEASNLAPLLGRFVLNEAFAAARKWLDMGIDFGRIAVNLSPQHVKIGTVFDDFTGAMARHGIKPEFVAAEVLESLFLDNEDVQQIEFIEHLHNIGVHIELDDFGTGYASLSHLSSLPIDGLKIDKSFVDRMLVDGKKKVVVQSLVSMARLMHIDLVCEGVETQEQYAFLRECGFCAIQGYLFARPMPFDEMSEWLETDAVELLHQVTDQQDNPEDGPILSITSARKTAG